MTGLPMLLLGVAMITTSAFAITVEPQEMARKDDWVKKHLLSDKGSMPFSFKYGGRASADLLPSWERKTAKAGLDDRRTEHVLTWTDAKTGLQVRCQAVDYSDFPVVEWTVYFKNVGKTNTPILADIQGMDVSFKRERSEEFVLRTIRGDDYTVLTYQPLVIPLGKGERQRFAPVGGRPTNASFPYYNLAWGGQGVIAVLGWSGQWATRFEADNRQSLRIVGGQELTNLKLLPGEEIRTPLPVLLFWKGGDWVRAQNLWRRWMIAHNLPRPGGKLMEPRFSAAANHLFPGYCASAADEIQSIKAYASHGVPIDMWWTDAGWYPCFGAWPKGVGTWEADKTRYPDGLKAVADAAHSNGMKYTVWFEPERVAAGTWLAKNHPEWLLGGTLLNLGNRDAWKWLTDHIDRFLTDEGIDMYRQDFNMDPLPFWRANDAPDRQGLTENLHVQGYLAYWDELRRRHPAMPIDACASGGRRNDLETMRRGVPLSKSDLTGEPTTVQNQLYGLAFWLPYFGGGVEDQDEYLFRSSMAPWTAVGYDTRKRDLDYGVIRRHIQLWRQVAPYFFGDYYPLTGYSQEADVWMAWQFDAPEQNGGVVRAFRRPKASEGEMTFQLKGLDSGATYELKDFDKEGTTRRAGRDLMEKGLRIKLEPKQAAIVFYSLVSTPAK